MPRYFFHIREGADLITDDEGSVLADIDEVRTHAVTGARSLLSAAVLEGRLPLNDAIEVANESSAVVLTVPYSSTIELC